MSYTKRWLPWFLLVTLAFIGVWFFYERIPKSDTRDTFLGNLFATIIGIFIGIPIALEISRYQSAIQEKQEKAKREWERLARKQRILNLVEHELIYNRDLLSAMVEKQGSAPGIVTYLGLKNDLWNALSDGGELHWIDDLKLLDSITKAYYHIRRIIFLEEKYFDPEFNSAVSSEGRNTYAGERIVKGVTTIRPDGLAAIEQALTEIEGHNKSQNLEETVLARAAKAT